MRARGWERDRSRLMGWRWAGKPEPPRFNLARFPDGTEQLLLACPAEMKCRVATTVEKAHEGDGIAWGYEARSPSGQQTDILMVGGKEQCEGARQRDSANGRPVGGSCHGAPIFQVGANRPVAENHKVIPKTLARQVV